MTFQLDPEVGAVLAALASDNAPMPPPPAAGDVESRRVAIASRDCDRDRPAVAHQLLIYPMLDDRNTTPDQHLVPVAAWSYDANITGWNALFGEGHEDTQVDPTALPGRLIGATRLPPTCIEVGQLDIFVDEDVRYALTLTLSQAGVPVELRLHTGVPREFDGIAFDTDVARRARADRIRVLQSL